MGQRKRLRKDVEEAIEERDELLDRVKEAVNKVDRVQNDIIKEYEEANGLLRGEGEGRRN
jgi:uncharacterized coiled-coil DUF342 family protein